jgi:hypothetical protein
MESKRNDRKLERREEIGVRKDRHGRVVDVKLDRHVLDPEAENAVILLEDEEERAGLPISRDANPMDAHLGLSAAEVEDEAASDEDDESENA